MIRRVAVALVLIATVPAASLAAGTPKPVPGKWKAVGLFDSVTGGSLTVTKKSVRGLVFTPGSGASTACGTTEVRVKGTFRLRTATRGGVTAWIVGRNTPKTGDGYSTVPATVTQGGASMKGAVKMIFRTEQRRFGSAEVHYGSCTIEFDVKKR
jgi:hypothetical protein